MEQFMQQMKKDPKLRELMNNITTVAVPTIRTFVLEAVNHIEDEKKKEEFKKKLDNILPQAPLAGMKICIQGREFKMFFDICKNPGEHNPTEEMNKFPLDEMEEEQKKRLMEERNMLFSAPVNIYRGFVAKHIDFIEGLIEVLPDDRKDIQIKIEVNTSTYYMYTDGIFVGMYVEEVKEVKEVKE